MACPLVTGGQRESTDKLHRPLARRRASSSLFILNLPTLANTFPMVLREGISRIPTLGGLKFASTLVIICVALSATVYFINTAAVDGLMTNEAKAASTSTAHYFEKYLPNLEAILDGEQPTRESKDFIARALVDHGVSRFKLYNTAGTFILDSQQLEKPAADPDGDKLGDHNAEAAQVLATNLETVLLESEHGDVADTLTAETYVPIVRHGKTIGVVEVYVDLTESAANFRRAFFWSSALIATIAAFAFSLPAFGFYLRTRQKLAADENVHFLANHDVLTALPNRTSFHASLAKCLNATLDNGSVATLNFIDLDSFKEINDSYGHDFGDHVLRAVSERFKGALREGDLVSRFGGDEFVIAQFDFTTNEQIVAATKRITSALMEPLNIDGREISMTASIGTAISPQHGLNGEQLIQNADTAVYAIKARGRNAHCYFEPKLDEEKRKRLALEAIVRNAVAAKRFELNFQPLHVLDGARLKGFEALLRLKDETGRPVSPIDFIPVAEDIGLIDEIGTSVLEKACMTAATWPSDLQVSVNLSVAQFKRRSVVASTKSALARSGISPNRLLLEITESLLMTDTDAILEQLKELKSLGIAIVMDDFGTGYSSLAYMLKFPFDRIKIDRGFISELGTANEDANTVVQTIIVLGHTLNMDVTAEGVETAAQASALRDMKCDDAQGYLYGLPMPAKDIPIFLLKTAAKEMGRPTSAPEQNRSVA